MNRKYSNRACLAACLVVFTTGTALTGTNLTLAPELLSAAHLAEGRIRGVVKDDSGAVMPDVNVVLKLKACKCEECEVPKECKCCPPQRSARTDSSGAFEFFVSAGVYDLLVSATGFKTVTITDITVSSRETQRVDVTLDAGRR